MVRGAQPTVAAPPATVLAAGRILESSFKKPNGRCAIGVIATTSHLTYECRIQQMIKKGKRLAMTRWEWEWIAVLLCFS